MKLNLKIFSAILLTLSAVACQIYDDSALKQELENHENRISALETLCKTMNADIVALRTVVTALDERDYITDVRQSTGGYTISFNLHSDITISDGAVGKDGAAGKDGHSPVVGSKKEGDVYYWTIDGEWMLIEGKKVPVSGEKGVTPELKIESGYWWVRYGSGSWVKMGKAVEEASSGIFSAIDVSDPYSVTFTLAGDGSTITIPRKVGFKIGTDFSNSTLHITKDTLILLTLPANIQENSFTAIQAKVVSEGGISVDVYTKASGCSWDVSIQDPSFTAGVYNGDAGILLEPTAVNFGEPAILEAMIVWADGSKTEAARAIKLTGEVSTTPGIYGLNSTNYAYKPGEHQINSYKNASAAGFALVHPVQEKYFLFSGLPLGLTVGRATSFTLTQNWTSDLAPEQAIEATVKQLSSGYIYLQDSQNVTYVLKY